MREKEPYKFLLTYSFENMEGMSDGDFKWYSTEEEMIEDTIDKKEYLKDFKVLQALEILSARYIKW